MKHIVTLSLLYWGALQGLHAQIVRMKYDNAKVKDALIELSKQAKLICVYDSKLIWDAKKVHIDALNKSASEVAEQCSRNQFFTVKVQGNNIVVERRMVFVRGKCVNQDLEPMPGITISVPGTDYITATDADGFFTLGSVDANALLHISAMEIITDSIRLAGRTNIRITTQQKVSDLSAFFLTHGSNGYATDYKKFSTANCNFFDKEDLKKPTSASILDKLNINIPGIQEITKIVKGVNQGNDFSLGPRVTINSNPNALIVVDNFPFHGKIPYINPDDIENIVVLKDAAATSIWGTRAGNGVIVINTKQSKYNHTPNLSFNSWISIQSKPNLFTQDIMSAADYIEIERKLFKTNFYRPIELSLTHAALSPVVESLIENRNGSLSASALEKRLDSFSNRDIRNEMDKHFYKNISTRNLYLNLDGGTGQYAYNFSGGYTFTLPEIEGSKERRWTLNLNNKYRLTKFIELTGTLMYLSNLSKNISELPVIIRPYTRLADENGKAAPAPYLLRQSYVDTAGGNSLLDWKYYPLSEFNLRNNTTTENNLRIQTGVRFTIRKGLNANVLYQYQTVQTDIENEINKERYEARDLVNRFTQSTSNGLYSPVPLGNIRDLVKNRSVTHNLRFQVNYTKKWKDSISLHTFFGRDQITTNSSMVTNRIYGYYENRPSGINNLDYRVQYPIYYYPSLSETIPYSVATSNLSDNYISYFSNFILNIKGAYYFSASGRLDKSNLFGASINGKTIPLFSTGMGWNIAQEKFYKINWLTFLKLRATIGTSGTCPTNVAAVSTIRYRGINTVGDPIATINNPPQPSLRWEKVVTLNLGTDFRIKKGIIEGSLDWSKKDAKDLMGYKPLDPTRGYNAMSGNVAAMSARQIDLIIKSKNFNKPFEWRTNFWLSYISDYVSRYTDTILPSWYYCDQRYLTIVPGRPLYGIYSYKFKGLDHNTGDPLGMLDKNVTNDHNGMLTKVGYDQLIYNGRSTPAIFGCLTNDFEYKNFSISFSITYKFNYYFRKNVLNYYKLFYGQSPGTSEYKRRWQRAGDELSTNIPSMPANYMAMDESRDLFYAYSDINVLRGDHIRFQNLMVNYELGEKSLKKLGLKNGTFYANMSNIAIIWRANKYNIDPDRESGYPKSIMFAIGFKGSIK